MTPDEAERAGLLVEEYRGIRAIRRDLKRSEPENGYERRVLCIEIIDTNDSSNGVDLPLDLVPKLLDHLETIIGDELAKLGVDPPKRGA